MMHPVVLLPAAIAVGTAVGIRIVVAFERWVTNR